MKLHLERASQQNSFTGYGSGFVLVNGQRFDRSLVVLPERIIPDWPAGDFDSLRPEHFASLVPLGREIVLLGTGAQLRFPPAEIARPLIEAGVGLEAMDVQAACRTYNILLSEGRRVAAALLLG